MKKIIFGLFLLVSCFITHEGFSDDIDNAYVFKSNGVGLAYKLYITGSDCLICEGGTKSGYVPKGTIIFNETSKLHHRCDGFKSGASDYWSEITIPWCDKPPADKRNISDNRVLGSSKIYDIDSNRYPGIYAAKNFCFACQSGYERAERDIERCGIKKDTCVLTEKIACCRKDTTTWANNSCSCSDKDGVQYEWNSDSKICVAKSGLVCSYGGKVQEHNTLITPTTCSALDKVDVKIGNMRNALGCKVFCLKEKGKNVVKTVAIIEMCKPEVKTNFGDAKKDILSKYDTRFFGNGEYIKSCGTTSTCEDYKKYPNRYKCCLAGNKTKWNGKKETGTCTCKDKNKDWDPESGKCVDKVGEKTCAEKYETDEAIACCESEDAYWDDDIKVCKCIEEDHNWKYNDAGKTGVCEEVEKRIIFTPCKYVFRTDIECSNGIKYDASNEYILNKEDVDKIGTCDEAKTKLASFEKLVERSTHKVTERGEVIELICGSGDNISVIPSVVRTEINNAQMVLKSFFNRAKEKASVWRTEDGNFNGSRLASDLTAGVVLGTVGGVVSSNIIKKNQIKSGFEVLHCAIGGQIVADLGDEFTVRPNGR